MITPPCRCRRRGKTGALRNGAPFKDWVLPGAMERVRRKLTLAADGNRQMVDILTAVLSDGLAAVEAACAEALQQGVHSADVILNLLARRRDPGRPGEILTPAALRCGIPRSPTASATTLSGGPANGPNRSFLSDGRT